MNPISTRSQRKRTQLRKEDQERRRWRTRIAVKRRDDCQAWNLLRSALLPNTDKKREDVEKARRVVLPG